MIRTGSKCSVRPWQRKSRDSQAPRKSGAQKSWLQHFKIWVKEKNNNKEQKEKKKEHLGTRNKKNHVC